MWRTRTWERALRVVSVERGFDPREFTLVAFGGAGPLHACELADALELPRVLVPRSPGVLCALGAARADLTSTRTRSVLRPIDGADDEARAALDEAEALARGDLASRHLEGSDSEVEIVRALDLRYAGQSYELTVPFERTSESDPDGARVAFDTARRAFDAAHLARYAHADSQAIVEVVNARVTARVRAPTLMTSRLRSRVAARSLPPSRASGSTARGARRPSTRGTPSAPATPSRAPRS
ncbi:MAG: hydantoinase/oxoprolinase family protein [Dehalococcoidia bacterium]